MKLRYTPQARADLRAIRAYIAQTLANPQAAERITRQLLQSCQRLKAYPKLGLTLADKLSIKADLRCLVSGNYLVFYRVEPEYVSVIRILDGRTDYLQVLFREEL